MPSEKFKVFTGTIYPDSESYVYSDVLSSLNFFDEWAFILHDKDVTDSGELKKPHVHWVGRGDPRTVSCVAKKLGLKENEVEHGRNFKSLIQYLVHKNDPDKFQYDWNEISSNIDCLSQYFRCVSEGRICKDLCTAKLRMSWYDLIEYAIEHDCYDVLRRNIRLIQLCWAEVLPEKRFDPARDCMRDIF